MLTSNSSVRMSQMGSSLLRTTTTTYTPSYQALFPAKARRERPRNLVVTCESYGVLGVVRDSKHN